MDNGFNNLFCFGGIINWYLFYGSF